MTAVVFETATFADAIKKADRVAPSKGAAYDKTSGIVIEVDPNQSPAVVVRATDTNIFYREWVEALKVEGEATVWRLPSTLLATMAASLPIGTGREVKLEEVDNNGRTHLVISSGKTKARFNLMVMDLYPDWDVFHPDDLEPASELGGRISQVEWAADKTELPYSGLCFTEGTIIVTDKYRLARVPVSIPNLPEGQTIVPGGILGGVLKQTGDVLVGFTPHQVLIMPNDTTQLRVVRYDSQFPPGISRIMDADRPNHVEVSKSQLLEVMRRATGFSGAERMPTIRMFFGQEEIAVVMDNTDVGALRDIMDVPGQCVHSRVEIKFTPRNLMEALEHAPNDRVVIGYDPAEPGKIMHVDGGSGYEVWVVTRKESSAA